jgi:hypothetical protein
LKKNFVGFSSEDIFENTLLFVVFNVDLMGNFDGNLGYKT